MTDQPPPTESVLTRPMTPSQAVMAGLVIAGTITAFAMHKSDPGPSPQEQTASPAAELSSGSPARTRTDRAIFGVDSKPAFDDLVKAAVAKDEVGYQEVLREHGTRLSPGTPVLVIESHGGSRRVRLQGAELPGKAVWVFVEDLVPR
jgi:hypothetical protein